jgi:hypothetical protein
VKAGLAGVAAALLLAAGCGGSGSDPPPNAASLVPAQALVFARIDSDRGSAQLRSAQSVLDKFPFRQQVLDGIRALLAQGHGNLGPLEDSVGPEVDLAMVGGGGNVGPVAYTQPADPKAFAAQLDQRKLVHTTIAGWTVFSSSQAYLDTVEQRKADLSDAPAFRAAAATLPESALVAAYASPLGAHAVLRTAGTQAAGIGGVVSGTKWTAAALTSSAGAVQLEVHTRQTTPAPPGTAASLADKIPAGSIVALSLARGGSTITPQMRSQLRSLGGATGLDLPTLVGAFDGPLIAYLRAGVPIPEVTIASRPAHPARLVPAVAKLIARMAKAQVTPVPTKVDGGTLNAVDLGSITIYFGVNDGIFVVTDSANALAELNGSVGHLTGEGVFKDAAGASDMPGDNQGFLFVDVKDALPALNGFAQLANQTLPPSVQEDLKPLRSLLVYGARSGPVQTLVAHLATD